MTKEQAKIIYKDVIQQFGYVNNPVSVDAVYVLRDGNFLDTCGGFTNHQHINVAKYISQKYNIKDLNELNNGSNFMLNVVGAVKITCWDGGKGIKGIYLPKHELAGPQYDAIEEFIARIAKNVTEEWPLWIATYDESQQIEYKKSTYLEDRVIADIEHYYYSGKLELTESLLTEKIVKMGSKWQVQSEKGRNMGTYDTKAEAEERLRQVHYFKYANEALLEDTRNMLVSKSRGVGQYRDQSRGKNRFERKKLSKIARTVKQYNQIDMNKLFKEDLLIVHVPVQGETDQYTVSIKMEGVIAEIAKNIKNNKNQFEYRTVIQALTKVFNTGNVYVKCTCDDYCLHPDTKIKLLDGTTVTVEDLEKKVKASSTPIYLYSVDNKGDFKPGKIKDVWVSGSANEMLKITLDNGKSIITTPEHPYMLRNGQYKEAKYLEVGNSLMPLYFGMTKNGYETVKANSKATTEFYSTYKQVANALLQKEIEEAKERSGENVVAIHHKDFNKSNNSPENLLPMGAQEHYKYHYEHVFDSGVFDKFKAAGEEYRKLVMDHTTPEYKKQAAVMSTAMQDYWADLTDEEKLADSEHKRAITKTAWEKGCFDTEKRKAADVARKDFLHTPEMEAKAADGIRKYWANLSDEEREKVILQRKQNLSKGVGWNKGKHLSDEDKFNKSQAALNRPQELKDLQTRKIRETKMLRVFNKMLEDNVDLTAENYEKYRSLYFNKSPRLSVLFDDIEEAIKYFKLNHKIVKIENISYDFLQPVYDIEVENYHNFYVDAGVILHNCYRFAHWNIVNNVSVDDTASDPGPGKGIRNPNDDKGRGCKHVLLVLANGDWLLKVASVISNYVHYAEEHLQKPFLKLIFPKLYGVPADEMVEQNLIDTDEYLDSSTGLIDAINEYGKNRGKYQKGSNKNPITGTGGRTKKEDEPKEENTEGDEK